MNRLLVTGGASFDVLHIEDRTIKSIGGVGMDTALVAHCCGLVLFQCPETLPGDESMISVCRV